MLWKDAIREVLKGAGQPLHINDIIAAVKAQGLRQNLPKNAYVVVSTILGNLAKEENVLQLGVGVVSPSGTIRHDE
jgi:hypothetical protein